MISRNNCIVCLQNWLGFTPYPNKDQTADDLDGRGDVTTVKKYVYMYKLIMTAEDRLFFHKTVQHLARSLACIKNIPYDKVRVLTSKKL